MFKNVATKIALFAFDSSTNLPKSGDAANLTAYVSKDYGATTVLADTSATELDATNAKGWYLFDVAQAESNADFCLFTGKSSTSNIVVVARPIFMDPNRFTSLVIDAAGLADANMVKAGPTGIGTAQTARDIGGAVPAATAGAAGGLTIAGANAATTFATLTVTGAFTVNGTSTVAQTGDSFARIGAAGAGLTALGDARLANLDLAVSTRMASFTQPTGFLAATFPSDPADQSLIIAATDAVMTRLGVPAGASVLADIASIAGGGLSAAGVRSALGMASANLDTQIGTLATASALSSVSTLVGGVKTKTDSLTFTVANTVDANLQRINDVLITGNGQSGTEFGV